MQFRWTRRDFLRAKVGLATAGAIAVAGCTGDRPPDSDPAHTQEWATFRADVENTGSNGATGFPVDEFDPTWAASGGTDSAPSGICLADGSAYGTYPDVGVARFDLADGTLEWTATLPGGNRPVGPPSIANGNLLVPDETGAVVALDTGSADVRWRSRTDIPGGSRPPVTTGITPGPDGDRIVVQGRPTSDIVSIDAASGTVDATYDRSGEAGVGSPVVTAESIVAATENALIGLDRADLTEDWEVRTAPAAAPVYHRGFAVVPLDGGGVAGIDATPEGAYVDGDDGDDRIRWEASIGNIQGPLARSGSTVIGSRAGGLVALRSTDGGLVWEIDSIDPATPPTVSGGLVYVGGTDGTLYVIDAVTGVVLSATDVGGSAGWTRLAVDDDAVVASWSGRAPTGVDPVEVDGENGGGQSLHTVAVEGTDTLSGVADLDRAVDAVLAGINDRSHTDVFEPPSGADLDGAENLLRMRADELIESYENGDVPFGTARETLERTVWGLMRMQHHVAFSHHDVTSVAQYTGAGSAAGTTELGGPGLVREACRGLVRALLELVTMLPLLRIVRGVGKAGRALLPAARRNRLGDSSLKRNVDSIIDAISTAKNKRIGAATGYVDDLIEQGHMYEPLGELLKDWIKEAPSAAADNGMEFLTPSGIFDVFDAAVNWLVDGIAARIERWVERPADLVTHRYEGYTVAETIESMSGEEMFDYLTDQESLPGNRQQSADRTEHARREANARVRESRELLSALELEYPDEYSVSLSEIMDFRFEVESAARVGRNLLWAVVEFVSDLIRGPLDLLTGVARWERGIAAVDDQAKFAHEEALEQIFYGQYDDPRL